MNDMVVTVICAVLGSSGLSSVLTAWLNHKWSKEKKEDARIEALVNAQKVSMIDRVRYLGKCYIDKGCINLDDKENLKEMHKAYKGLGGNGHLDLVMEEVEKLPVSSEDCGD